MHAAASKRVLVGEDLKSVNPDLSVEDAQNIGQWAAMVRDAELAPKANGRSIRTQGCKSFRFSKIRSEISGNSRKVSEISTKSDSKVGNFRKFPEISLWKFPEISSFASLLWTHPQTDRPYFFTTNDTECYVRCARFANTKRADTVFLCERGRNTKH